MKFGGDESMDEAALPKQRAHVFALFAAWLFVGCTDPRYARNDADGSEDAAVESGPDAESSSMAALDAGSDAAGALEASIEGDATAAHLDAGSADASVEPGQMLDAMAEASTQPDASDSAVADTAAAADTGSKAPVSLVLTITADEDDALWRQQGETVEELLHFISGVHGSSGHTIEVSTNQDQTRAGVRFRLPVGGGAQILSAKLTLTRIGGVTVPADTLRVQVYDADNVPPFDASHAHTSAAEHAAGGLWPTSIGGFAVGGTTDTVTSPELSTLVQHVVDRPGFARGGYVGFVLFPDQMPSGEYAEFIDSAQGPAPQLKLTYVDGSP